MRTLNKALCLVLSVVMVLGLCAVSVSAAETFSDQKDIQYAEAAEVLTAIGVFEGYPEGDFQPATELTRAQGAVIIARLLGQNAKGGTAPFDDCADVNSWAGFAIQYCAEQGIINGVGDNKFDPQGKLTGSAFAKMLLGALGYDAEIEGMTGSNWEIGVAKLVRNLSLDKGIDEFDQTANITRETAAQLSFTTLTKTMVYYSTQLDVGTNGTSVNTNLRATNVTNTASTYYADGATGFTAVGAAAGGGGGGGPVLVGGPGDDGNAVNTMQLCEQYFPRLKKDPGDFDDNGRLATTWYFKGEEVTSTAKDADFKTVAKNTKSYEDVIKDFRKSLDTDSVTSVYLNGDSSAITLTSNAVQGDVIELYVNEDDISEVTSVVVTRYRSGKVSGAVATRTSGGVEEVRVPGIVGSWTKAEDVYGYEDLAKDDIVYYYETDDGTYHIFLADSFEGALTTYKAWDRDMPAKYTIGGKQYMINGNAGTVTGLGTGLRTTADPTSYNDTYAYYTDDNGFIIYASLVESGAKDYVMIYDLKFVATDASSSLANSGSAEARLVFMDGTTQVVTIDKIDGYTPVIYDNNGGGTARAITALGGNASSSNALYYGTDADDVKNGNTTAGNATAGTASAAPSTDLAAGTYYAIGNNNVWGSRTSTEYYVALSSASSAANNTLEGQKLYTYSVASNGKYTLTSAERLSNVTTGGNARSAATSSVTAQASTSRLTNTGNNIAVNDNTVFTVINNGTNVNNPKFTVYTGKKNCPTFNGNISFTWAATNGIATNVVVYNTNNNASGGSWIYMLEASSSTTTQVKNSDGTTSTYSVFKGLVEGDTKEKDLYLTAEAVADLTTGIGLYTDPTYDNYGNISGLNAIAAGTTRADRNQTMTLGYALNGTTLQTNKTYDEEDYGRSYDCPSNAIVIVKDGNSYTIGTADQELTEDANDQIYVSLTNTTSNRANVIYVIKQADNNTGIASITNSIVDTVTRGTDKAEDITIGSGSNEYTINRYVIAVGGGTININTNARSKVEISGNSPISTVSTYTSDVQAAWTAATAFSATSNTLTKTDSGVSFAASSNNVYLVRITAEDGVSVAYYAISVTA